MFGWNTSRKTRYGMLIDIGSGSVSAGITTSNASATKPDLVWSMQQIISLEEHHNQKDVLEKIIGALKNVFEASGNAGIRALKAYDRNGQISYVQIGVSAPWSYTITKKVVLVHDKEFELTESILEQAENEAEQQAKKELDSLTEGQNRNISMTFSKTIATETKGYVVAVPFGEKMNKITLSRLFCYVDSRLMNVIDEYCERIFPSIEYSVHSFMSLFYFAIRDLPINTSELCIADITSEAIEIGVIRNGILEHTTHIQSGARSIASELTRFGNFSHKDTSAYLRDDSTTPTHCKFTVEEACALCEAQIAKEMELEAGIVTIPNTLLFHTNAKTESFFKERLVTAFRQVHGGNVTPLAAPKLFDAHTSEMSALLISAYVFKDTFHQLNV
ncbi:MAG: hypothetical protein WDZ68_01790 [Candidatus Paceibacterota bacterium]